MWLENCHIPVWQVKILNCFLLDFASLYTLGPWTTERKLPAEANCLREGGQPGEQEWKPQLRSSPYEHLDLTLGEKPDRGESASLKGSFSK